MAHIYMKFDFGTDEEAAQQARHKLDVWKQTFRLDKKLQYKLDRPEEDSADEAETSAPKKKTAAKPKAGKSKADDSDASTENVSLLVRLYFSTHEKLTEQRWIDRIPSEEPFKSASPEIVRQDDPGFEDMLQQFGDPEFFAKPAR